VGTEDRAALPVKGIKRRILEMLAVLGRGSRGDELKDALDYKGRNWRYFLSDLVERGLLTRSDESDLAAVYEIADTKLRGDLVGGIAEDERAELEQMAGELPGAPADGEPARDDSPRPAEPPPPSSDEAVPEPETERESVDDAKGNRASRRKGLERRDRRRTRSGEESAEELLTLVEEALRRGDSESAARLAREGVDGEYQGEAPAQRFEERFRIRGAIANQRLSHLGEARALLEPIIGSERVSTEGGDPLAHLVAAECSLAEGDIARVKELLVEVDAFSSPSSAEQQMRRALVNAELALLEGTAADTLKHLATLAETLEDPVDRARAALLRGRALLVLSDFDRAIAPLQEALDIHRNRAYVEGEREAALCLGTAFHHRSQFAKSDTFLDRAQVLAREQGRQRALIEVALARGRVYADRGDADRLGNALGSLPKEARDEAGQRLLRARMMSLKGQNGDAIEALESLTETELCDTDAALALRELGVCYRLIGHSKVALEPLERSLKHAERTRNRVLIARSRVDYALGLLDQTAPDARARAAVGVKMALRLLEFIEVPDLVWRGYHALGRVYLAEGRHEDAFVRIGEATTILDQLLGRFQDRKSRESFLRRRFEPYRDRVVAFLSSRPYQTPLAHLKTASHEGFLDFLRKNADADADTGPRYNEIGRLSASIFDLYEDNPPASIEEIEQSNEACERVRKIVDIATKDDAPAVAGELLSSAIKIIRARMGAVGIIDSEREDAFEYFKGRSLPGREKSKTEPIRKLIREVAKEGQEVPLDGRDRLNGPGEDCALGFPIPSAERYSGAMILWFQKGQSPANHELEILRLMVDASMPSIVRELRLRAVRIKSAQSEQTLARSKQELQDALEDIGELRAAPSGERHSAGAAGARDELLEEALRGDLSYRSFLEAVEHDALEQALLFYRHDIGAMAKGLRFSRGNLRKKLVRFGLIEED